MLKIFNTLSRTKEEFIPRKEGEVGCMSAALQPTTIFIWQRPADGLIRYCQALSGVFGV